jgi:hypothetical protein
MRIRARGGCLVEKRSSTTRHMLLARSVSADVLRQCKRGRWPCSGAAYIAELLPDVLEGRIEPGRVFDRVIGLDAVPDGYRAMNEREAIKVMVKPRRVRD